MIYVLKEMCGHFLIFLFPYLIVFFVRCSKSLFIEFDMITARENEMYFSYKNFNVHVHATQCDKEHFVEHFPLAPS